MKAKGNEHKNHYRSYYVDMESAYRAGKVSYLEYMNYVQREFHLAMESKAKYNCKGGRNYA